MSKEIEKKLPVGQPRLVRHLPRCLCKYQREKSWGYQLMQWVGGRKSWKHLGNATHLEEVEIYARDYETVLVRCNGCGADVLREYPSLPNVTEHPTAGATAGSHTQTPN
jgi:hypothetical protein